MARIALTLLAIGIPMGLWAFAGNPIPAHLPSLRELSSALTRPDDGTILLGALRSAGWIAWALFVLSTLIPAPIRGGDHQ